MRFLTPAGTPTAFSLRRLSGVTGPAAPFVKSTPLTRIYICIRTSQRSHSGMLAQTLSQRSHLQNFRHVIIGVHAEVSKCRVWLLDVRQGEDILDVLELIVHVVASVVQL